MININISEIIEKNIKGIKFGLILADNVQVKKDDQQFGEELKELEQYLKDKFTNQHPSEDEVISHVRRMYRRIGWEPTKYRPSSEALVRRIIKGKGLYRINNIVDYGNIVSAKFHLPMGLYDVHNIKGEAIFDVGKAGESYRGISKDEIQAEGKLILRDDDGIFGNPTADSVRTSITTQTSKALAIFFCPPEVGKEYLLTVLDSLEKYYKKSSNGVKIEKLILQH